jgi:hypothetical protein
VRQGVGNTLPMLIAGEEGGWDEGNAVPFQPVTRERPQYPGDRERPHRLVVSIAFLVFSRAMWAEIWGVLTRACLPDRASIRLWQLLLRVVWELPLGCQLTPASLIPADGSRGAGAGAARIAEVAAGTGVHRDNQHKRITLDPPRCCSICCFHCIRGRLSEAIVVVIRSRQV